LTIQNTQHFRFHIDKDAAIATKCLEPSFSIPERENAADCRSKVSFIVR